MYTRSLLSAQALVALNLLVQPTLGAYTLEHSMTGENFFSNFNFFTGKDPTDGFVTYVDEATAKKGELISTKSDGIYIGVDTKTKLQENGPGRNSIRLEGKTSFNHGIVTLDVKHAPTGCGLWPALWLLNPSKPWPGNTGEVDIFEVTHNTDQNAMTLHTSEGCTIKNEGMAGQVKTTNCWTQAPGQQANEGCQVLAPSNLQSPVKASKRAASKGVATAGKPFNDQQGGMYAVVWSSQSIETYFFPRNEIPPELAIGGKGGRGNGTTKADKPKQSGKPKSGKESNASAPKAAGTAATKPKRDATVPAGAAKTSAAADKASTAAKPKSSSSAPASKSSAGGRTVDPASWKKSGIKPLAVFAGCDLDKHIADLSVIINTDFCGEWAGATWASSGCAASTGVSTCNAYVAGHPEAFKEAHWLLGGVEIWKGS